MHKLAQKYFTAQEYLELEESAEYKSEYYKGEIFAMAGGSINHNQIIMNVGTQLSQTQPHHKCRSFATELKLWIEEIDLFTYPDLMIICDKPKFYSGRIDTILNPLIIIEVLSRSTEAYDRGKKFQFYRSIPSFQEYILIDQYSVHIDQFYIDSTGKWSFKDYNDIKDILKFSKIDCDIPLEKIYHLVDFELKETESA
ncbi:MAG: Uma2 family endonuclease [bacterium]|jgi:Uma2 family endonuclease|nr:Uma2 family endonuclease [bacterium]